VCCFLISIFEYFHWFILDHFVPLFCYSQFAIMWGSCLWQQQSLFVTVHGYKLRVCKSTLNIEFHIETLKKLTLTSTLSTFQCFNFPHWHWIEFNVWDSIYWKTTQCFQCLNVAQYFSMLLNISQCCSIFLNIFNVSQYFQSFQFFSIFSMFLKIFNVSQNIQCLSIFLNIFNVSSLILIYLAM